MKNKFTLLILMVFIATQAQPVINAFNFPQPYEATIYSGYIIGTEMIEADGPNQIWDVTNYTPIQETINIGTYLIAPVETAPSSELFPDANFCTLTLSMQYEGSYEFYVVDDEKSVNVGSVSYSSAGYTTIANITPPIVDFVFPFSYNTILENTHQYPGYVQTIVKVYDSYGTLITPFGTYNDIIRIKKTYDGNLYTMNGIMLIRFLKLCSHIGVYIMIKVITI